MDKRVVPTKNYIIYAMVSLLSLLMVVYMANWYTNIRNEIENTPIINTVISEILVEELDSYIIENSSFVIYLASSNDTTIRSFEKSFKKLIIKNGISDQIIYLDASKITNNNIHKQLGEKYLTDSLEYNLSVSPNLLIFKDRKIVDVLFQNTNKVNIDIVKQFLTNHEVIE